MPRSPDPRLALLAPHELARLTARGELVRLRRGTYLPAGAAAADPAARHRQLVAATWPLLGDGSVLSHGSAAVLHGLPVWPEQLVHVQVTRAAGRGKRRGNVHVHVAPLADDEVVEVAGLRVTSPVRTVVDLGRALPLHRAVAAGDAALRRGLDADDLLLGLEAAAGRPGVAAARRAVALLDARSESPWESCSRVTLHHLGLAPTSLQHEVRDAASRLVARADFGWEEHRTLGEFDGLVKYGKLLRPGQTPSDAVVEEKRREDAVRDLDWQVVRWVRDDLRRPEELRARILRAFRRGTR
ncbi:hypothetical protein ACFFOM_09120 [Microlunatus capsulatus]|uniref:Transcriptional regulator, AbiEi antitoxin, Type IV TA system n=1 Tax=Microlunatus capsulatus TaxID=99117 RepID=A0ABS4ZAM5_9ACTN|nr:hypothetical protein [Microlunatus capsulatus]MBP2418105.1 hypothetical protein [Microlunatus capsulatus]